MAFMDDDFLLTTDMARSLWNSHAKKMPIFDYHCHLNPKEIAENRTFDSITDIWLGGDHYKWRQMRTCGIDEKYITGCGSEKEKFTAWARTMDRLIGNPLYHWTHLELQRYFSIHSTFSEKSADAIYEEANRKLKTLDVNSIMKMMNVYAVGTTDDPVDSLEYHKELRNSGNCPAKVIPSFRPDKALNIEKEGFKSYITALAKAADMPIKSAEDVVEALIRRLDYFVENGCLSSDHSLVNMPHTFKDYECVNTLFLAALEGKTLTAEEIDAWKSYLLTNLAKAYSKKEMVMQLHLNSIRDTNTPAFNLLGPDTGYDAVNDVKQSAQMARFMDRLAIENAIPRTILYSLNPNDYYPLATLMGSYQGGGIPGRIQLGSAWWFNDHRDGMEYQMKTLGNLGSLPLFVGMLTDSRSFLSYPRHEYFRRILCNMLGQWAERGEIPADEDYLGKIVEDISFNNAKAFFEKR